MEVTMDIETVPNGDGRALEQAMAEAEKAKAACKAPGNYKDPQKIAEYIQAAKAEIDAGLHDKVAKTSFDGALGHICVIGMAIDDQDPIAFYENSTEPHKHEGRVIKTFFDYLEAQYAPSRQTRPHFIGHNIVGFDLRFLFQRAVVLGIRPPGFIPFHAKPWDDVVYDTMSRWAGFKGENISLDKLAKALGLPGKQGIDGSQVWPMVAAGNIEKVADYCAHTDVAQTRDVYKRMTFQTLPVVQTKAA